MIRPRATFASIAATILAIPVLAAASLQPDLDACEQHLRRSSGGEAPALCLYQVATGNGPLQTAASQRLGELATKHPEDPWLLLYLGRLKWQTRKPGEAQEQEAARLYLRAADIAGRQGMAAVEYEARSGLCRILRDVGRLDEAEAEVERAIRVAESSGSPLLGLRAKILRAMHWFAQGEFEQAYQTLHRVQGTVGAESPYTVQRDYLFALAKAAQQTGRFRETRQAFRLAAERAALAGDLDWRAQALYGIANLSRAELSEVPSDHGRQQVLELARHALDAAHLTGKPAMEAQSLWILGFLEADDARGKLERCFEVAATPWEKSFCRSALAELVAATDPGMAEAAIHEALSLAQKSGYVQARTASWISRMHVSWTLGPRERALADARAALDAIEALRDQQGGSAGQPGLFSTWAEQYYWISGRLLDARDLESAFGIIERMRSRTLIDSLGLSGRNSRISPALYARRADIFLEIASVQRRLFDPALGSAERAKARADLGDLEAEEEALRSQIAQANPALRQVDFASLEQVREALADDEALLSFQIAPWKDLAGDFGGGSWLLVSTRKATRLHRLSRDRTDLRANVTTFIGLIESRDDFEAKGASSLYERLLAPALAELPPEVRRLVIVADDYLHRLPFAALRPPDGNPLATRYEISLAPSASLWLHWRKTRPAPTITPALVLADPITLATRSDASVEERSATALMPVRLSPLPYARTEGKSVIRQLDGGDLLMGMDASETYIKRNVPGQAGLVHFAAHALTDEVNPDRSGIYLSPGNNEEDGVLQVREIAELNLDGRIVVLSTCGSASGGILLGEGVMGLARAFFQAGAHTVVASLWNLRDDDGAALFDRFYHHLGKGKSVAAALQAAQLDRMNDGAPAEAWAGVVVLGDGDRIPVLGGRRPSLIPWTLGLIAVLALAYLAFRARQRRMTTA